MNPSHITTLQPVRCPYCNDEHFPAPGTYLCVRCVEIGNEDPARGVLSAVLMGVAMTTAVILFIWLAF